MTVRPLRILSLFVGIVISIGSLAAVLTYRSLDQPGTVALLYHGVADQPGRSDRYSISRQSFQAQLDTLVNRGYSALLPEEIAEARQSRVGRSAIILTFDDSPTNHFTVIFPMLKARGLRGTFFVITSAIDKQGYLTVEQIREMKAAGMAFGSHGHTHRFLDTLSAWEVNWELSTSKEILQSILHEPILAVAPPGGWFNNTTIAESNRLGYRYFFGCELGVNPLEKQPFVFRRNEVLDQTTLAQFEDLLQPRRILLAKLAQSTKFAIHDVLGSELYSRLSRSLRPAMQLSLNP